MRWGTTSPTSVTSSSTCSRCSSLGNVLGSGRYGDLDVDTVRTMLDEVARLAEGPVADSFADADRNPPVFDPERHTITRARGVGEIGAGGQGRRMVAHRDSRGDRRRARAARR